MMRRIPIFVGLLLPLVSLAADDRAHWAFQPLKTPRTPSTSAVAAPIDAFIFSRLEGMKLSPSPEASRAVLVRRLHLDLIGLPPTPEEIDDCVRDVRPDWYERLVDRLLASPHFGERWGRHWLDGAGYVDVVGGDNDAGTVKLGDGSKWRYRDHVVRAVNIDKPWREFLLDQIAGDERIDRRAARWTPDVVDRLVATGFLRTAADDTDERELNTLDIRHGILQRTGEVLIGNLLGLSFHCAKCHDHKFEPIAQKDYYRILAVLAPAFNPQQWVQPKDRVLPDVPPAEKQRIDARNAALDAAVKELRTTPGTNDLIAALEARKHRYGTVQAVYDVGPPTPLRLLKRGQHDRPAEEVAPGSLSVLRPSDAETKLLDVKPVSGSGRRLALAQELTDPSTRAGALAVRVRVNRVWHQLFGRGLVSTPDNFGVSGAKPTHPDLLEHLASEFVRGNGALKPLLRTIVTTHVYRQTSESSATADPDNRWLARQRLRRLESEIVRDALLHVGGRLDRVMGGPAVPTVSRPDGSVVVAGGTPGENRRSLYLLGRRNYHPTLLAAFDQPLLTTNCPCRSTSAVVQQSLTMLNDEFVRAQARGLAERVMKQEPDERRQAALAFKIALGRAMTERETTWIADWRSRTTTKDSLTRLCLVLLNTSEFLYTP